MIKNDESVSRIFVDVVPKAVSDRKYVVRLILIAK